VCESEHRADDEPYEQVPTHRLPPALSIRLADPCGIVSLGLIGTAGKS
jgi:hypothetical protein